MDPITKLSVLLFVSLVISFLFGGLALYQTYDNWKLRRKLQSCTSDLDMFEVCSSVRKDIINTLVARLLMIAQNGIIRFEGLEAALVKTGMKPDEAKKLVAELNAENRKRIDAKAAEKKLGKGKDVRAGGGGRLLVKPADPTAPPQNPTPSEGTKP